MEVPTPGDWSDVARLAESHHTVRVSFSDRLGRWRGKRVPIDQYVLSGGKAAFGNGLIVSDVLCDVIEQTPFTNMSTGYPDMFVLAQPQRTRVVGWAPGELFCFGVPTDEDGVELPVAPATALRRVQSRLQERNVDVRVDFTLSGRLMRDPVTLIDPAAQLATDVLLETAEGLDRSGVDILGFGADPAAGAVTLGIATGDPFEVAESAVIATGALVEVAARHGVHATFITRLPNRPAASTAVRVQNPPAAPVGAVSALLGQARPLVQPSVNAVKSMAPSALYEPRGELAVRGISPEADPFTAVAVVLAAVGQSPDGVPDPVSADAEDFSLAAGAAGLAKSSWLPQWLGSEFIDNSVPLLLHEARLFEAAVTDWEIDRYWSMA